MSDSFSILVRILKLGFQQDYAILNTLDYAILASLYCCQGLCLHVNIVEAIGLLDTFTYGMIINNLYKTHETSVAIGLLILTLEDERRKS
jgi:hypothetical protein